MFVHGDLPQALPVFVESRYLYDGAVKPDMPLYQPCRLVAVSSYPGHVPTFKILLADGAVFDYIPPSAILFSETAPSESWKPSYDLTQLVYHNCPEETFSLHRHKHLAGPAKVFLSPAPFKVVSASYLFTMDWYADNASLNVMVLHNGQLALLPNHKILFGDQVASTLPAYKKMHGEWKVSRG